MAKDYVISQLQKGEKKRCRKWRIDIKDGRYPSGKQKYKSQRFEGTYTQAEKRAKELAEDRTKLRSRWTFEGYAQHVIDTKLSAGQITKSTHDNYEVYLRMANRTIGGIDLSDGIGLDDIAGLATLALSSGAAIRLQCQGRDALYVVEAEADSADGIWLSVEAALEIRSQES